MRLIYLSCCDRWYMAMAIGTGNGWSTFDAIGKTYALHCIERGWSIQIQDQGVVPTWRND